MSTAAQRQHTDPLLEATIARALAPYIGRVSPQVLATMREGIEEMLTTDELALAMIEQLRDDQHAVPDMSGEGRIDGVEASIEPKRGARGA